MKVFVFFIIAVSIFILAEKLLRKWLRVERRKVSETPGKNVDRWGRGIITLIFLCSLPFILTKDVEAIKWYWLSYLMLIWGFQSFVQWKYLKNSKEYVITLIFLLLALILTYSIDYFV